MPVYTVQIPFSGVIEVEVIADRERDAIRAVLDAEFDLELEFDESELEAAEVVEWEIHKKVPSPEDAFFGVKKAVVIDSDDDDD